MPTSIPQHESKCVKCNYDLSGLSPSQGAPSAQNIATTQGIICPECGAWATQSPTASPATPPHPVAVFLVIVLPTTLWTIAMCIAWGVEKDEIAKYGHPTDASESLGDPLVSCGFPAVVIVYALTILLGALYMLLRVPRKLWFGLIIAAVIGTFVAVTVFIGLPRLCEIVGLI